MLISLPHDCVVCLGPHDEEVHAATARAHEWFRQELAKKLGSRLYEPDPSPVTATAAGAEESLH